jgi:meso-butanediol dehydrogenase/(S,S)-butanediol dehydrogenase/diacetyl reductase
MDQRLSGKVAIVTGAGQGIGKAVALRLAQEGASIVAVDINGETAVATARELQALGRPAFAHSMDVGRLSASQLLVEHVAGVSGRIDVLVNAAGVARTQAFLELTEEDWDRVMDTNLKGTVFCMQAVGRQMIRQIPPEVVAQGRADRSYGKIVNFASISGRRGRSVQMAYAASKAAIISVTQSAALAFSSYNINVNAVCPGVIPTPMWDQIDRDRSRLMGAQPGEALKAFVEKVPLQRAGTPEDVAAAVAFLCSSDADYITGQTLNVDGGFEMN